MYHAPQVHEFPQCHAAPSPDLHTFNRFASPRVVGLRSMRPLGRIILAFTLHIMDKYSAKVYESPLLRATTILTNPGGRSSFPTMTTQPNTSLLTRLTPSYRYHGICGTATPKTPTSLPEADLLFVHTNNSLEASLRSSPRDVLQDPTD